MSPNHPSFNGFLGLSELLQGLRVGVVFSELDQPGEEYPGALRSARSIQVGGQGTPNRPGQGLSLRLMGCHRGRSKGGIERARPRLFWPNPPALRSPPNSCKAWLTFAATCINGTGRAELSARWLSFRMPICSLRDTVTAH